MTNTQQVQQTQPERNLPTEIDGNIQDILEIARVVGDKTIGLYAPVLFEPVFKAAVDAYWRFKASAV